MTINPKNLTAQLHFRAAGNPPTTMPETAISNSYPGLEFDFRNIWRRLFVGIELHESDNYVVRGFGKHRNLVGHRLLIVAGDPTVTAVVGPQMPGGSSGQLSDATMLEWSNSMARVLHRHAGRMVKCEFTANIEPQPVPIPDNRRGLLSLQLRVRPMFASSKTTRGALPVIEQSLVEPGELTQSLCSPWQNDYRECACYYWAASRPDYVNVDLNERGVTTGNNWLAKSRDPKEYVPDDFADSRLIGYEDLFQNWQALLQFVVEGKDYSPGDESD